MIIFTDYFQIGYGILEYLTGGIEVSGRYTCHLVKVFQTISLSLASSI